MGDCSVVMIFGCIDPAEAELRARCSQRLTAQRIEQLPASSEIAGVEQRLGKGETSRQIARRLSQRPLEFLGGLAVARQPTEHDTVEVEPFEAVRRQSLGTSVRLMRGVKLLPRLQHPRKCADRLRIGRARCRRALKRGDRLARRGRVRRQFDRRERRQSCLASGTGHHGGKKNEANATSGDEQRGRDQTGRTFAMRRPKHVYTGLTRSLTSAWEYGTSFRESTVVFSPVPDFLVPLKKEDRCERAQSVWACVLSSVPRIRGGCRPGGRYRVPACHCHRTSVVRKRDRKHYRWVGRRCARGHGHH